MSRYSSHDPYLDSASGVLKNRFGITDEPTPEATEASLVALRSYELAQRPLAGRFDLRHLLARIIDENLKRGETPCRSAIGEVRKTRELRSGCGT